MTQNASHRSKTANQWQKMQVIEQKLQVIDKKKNTKNRPKNASHRRKNASYRPQKKCNSSTKIYKINQRPKYTSHGSKICKLSTKKKNR